MNISLNEWLGSAGNALEERICMAHSNPERISILEAFFLGRITEPTYKQRRLRSGIAALFHPCHHPVTLKTLAGLACLSERQLERTFSEYVGTTPKQFQRIVRLNSAIRLAETSPQRTFTSIAIEAGYYDQAHFINEFRDLTGYTPRQFFSLPCYQYQ